MQDLRLDRRRFLAASAAVTIVPSLAVAGRPTSARMIDDPIILGEGENRWRCEHDWLTPPNGIKFGDTHGLAQDAAGRIYVAHTVGGGSTRKSGVCVYTPTGEFIGDWGAEFAGGAHGIDLRKEPNGEFLYHCDTRRRAVVKTGLDGKVVWTSGDPVESAA
ncbi:MAG: hypothetical protein CMJ22_01610, partial [Phycisphaerae bacterium]|nr:hypothetical protein [Phycisphaerae bacterium]